MFKVSYSFKRENAEYGVDGEGEWKDVCRIQNAEVAQLARRELARGGLVMLKALTDLTERQRMKENSQVMEQSRAKGSDEAVTRSCCSGRRTHMHTKHRKIC